MHNNWMMCLLLYMELQYKEGGGGGAYNRASMVNVNRSVHTHNADSVPM